MLSSANRIPGRNVNHRLIPAGSRDKVLPQGETEESLMLVYQSTRTNLPWWWEICIHLCLFYIKTTVLIRKEGRRKIGLLLDN